MAKHVKQNIFHARMKQLFGSLSACWRDTKISAYMSFETARQILLLGKEPSSYHLVVVMSALNFATREIIEQLKARGDTYIWPLLSPDDETDTTLHRLARAMRHMGPKTNAAVRALVKAVLSEERIDLNAKNWEGLTPIMVAAKSGNDDMATLLLELGAEYAAEDRQGLTVLEYGSRGGCKGLLKRIRKLHPEFILERFITGPDHSTAE